MYIENITAITGEEEFTFPSGSEYIVKDVIEPTEEEKYY